MIGIISTGALYKSTLACTAAAVSQLPFLSVQLDRYPHFRDHQRLFSLEDLAEVQSGQLLLTLRDIHRAFVRHIKEDCFVSALSTLSKWQEPLSCTGFSSECERCLEASGPWERKAWGVANSPYQDFLPCSLALGRVSAVSCVGQRRCCIHLTDTPAAARNVELSSTSTA